VLDALAELKKYQRINLNGTDFAGWGGTVHGVILDRIADDINRISKNQFRIGQQIEDCFEEILHILHQELDLAKTYQQSLAARDDLIKEMNRRAGENEKRIESLVMALVRVSDMIDIIFSAISSSGDEDWIRQMERVKNSLAMVLAENNLDEIGNEKYFDDALHDVVSLVEDPDRDFREVAGVEQKGYAYRGKILRKARVVINNYRKDHHENE